MPPQTIAVFGGSSIFGMVDPSGGGFVGRFKAWHEAQHPRNKLYNLGIPGDTSTRILERLEREASLRKPDLILLQCGKNDSKRMDNPDAPPVTPIEQFRENLHAIIELARSLADVGWIEGYPFDESKTNPMTYWGKRAFFTRENYQPYNEVSEAVCEELGVPRLSTASAWTDADLQELLFEDGLHANEKGHQRLFEEFKESFLAQYD